MIKSKFISSEDLVFLKPENQKYEFLKSLKKFNSEKLKLSYIDNYSNMHTLILEKNFIEEFFINHDKTLIKCKIPLNIKTEENFLQNLYQFFYLKKNFILSVSRIDNKGEMIASPINPLDYEMYFLDNDYIYINMIFNNDELL